MVNMPTGQTETDGRTYDPTLTVENDLRVGRVKMYQQARYLGQRSFQVIVQRQTGTWTDTHNRSSAVSGPLK